MGGFLGKLMDFTSKPLGNNTVNASFSANNNQENKGLSPYDQAKLAANFSFAQPQIPEGCGTEFMRMG